MEKLEKNALIKVVNLGKGSKFKKLDGKTGFIVELNKNRILFQALNHNGRLDGNAVWLLSKYIKPYNNTELYNNYKKYRLWEQSVLSDLETHRLERHNKLKELAEKFNLTVDNVLEISAIINSF